MIETIEINASFIPLTQDKVAIVDTESYDYLNQFKWCAVYSKSLNGYYAMHGKHMGMLNGKKQTKIIRMHRWITNAPKDKVVDHINHDPLDNREKNLRVVSRRQNNQNKKHKGSSKYPGVHWVKRDKKWRASIKINGKSIHLGMFQDERQAAKAYEKAVRSYCHEELICKT